MCDLNWHHLFFAMFLTLLSDIRIAIAASTCFRLSCGILPHLNLKGGWIRSKRYSQENGDKEYIRSSMVCFA